MRYLYIDTSSSYLYTAIVKDDCLVAEIKENLGHKLSELALTRIVSMFEQNKLKAQDIDKIIVVDGPGSFTGIRIGITIAKVYAWSLKIPITTISALEAMATSSNVDTYKVPLIDARRGYVFAGIFDKNNKIILEPQYIKQELLNNKLDDIGEFKIISKDNLKGYDI